MLVVLCCCKDILPIRPSHVFEDNGNFVIDANAVLKDLEVFPATWMWLFGEDRFFFSSMASIISVGHKWNRQRDYRWSTSRALNEAASRAVNQSWKYSVLHWHNSQTLSKLKRSKSSRKDGHTHSGLAGQTNVSHENEVTGEYQV